jgi:hypothetical protein
VLYAIENGGFSGAIMPQNVVVGQDAVDVAKFVATYAGRQAPKVPGVPSCAQKSVGTIPAPTAAAATTGPTGPATGATGATGPVAATKTSGKSHGTAAKPRGKPKRKP